MIRVLVVDDHVWVRDALIALLSGTDDITVVGECTDGAEVPQAVAELQPDVVLMDVHMPIVSGLEATRQLRAAQSPTRVIITGSLPPGPGAVQAAAAGAAGVAVKGTPPQVLIEAIRAVASGEVGWFDAAAS